AETGKSDRGRRPLLDDEGQSIRKIFPHRRRFDPRVRQEGLLQRNDLHMEQVFPQNRPGQRRHLRLFQMLKPAPLQRPHMKQRRGGQLPKPEIETEEADADQNGKPDRTDRRPDRPDQALYGRRASLPVSGNRRLLYVRSSHPSTSYLYVGPALEAPCLIWIKSLGAPCPTPVYMRGRRWRHPV